MTFQDELVQQLRAEVEAITPRAVHLARQMLEQVKLDDPTAQEPDVGLLAALYLARSIMRQLAAGSGPQGTEIARTMRGVFEESIDRNERTYLEWLGQLPRPTIIVVSR